MKKIFTMLSIAAFSTGAFAQQIPNGGFETWTSPLNPDMWSTVATAYGGAGANLAAKDNTVGNFIQGLASARLTSDSIPGQAAAGIVAGQLGLGSNNANAGITFLGYPYTKRPDTIFYFYKYTPGPGLLTDSGIIEFNLTKAGVSLFGGELGGKLPGTSNQWASTYVPLLPYYSGAVTGAPDTLDLIFVSGNPAAPIIGSTLWIDSVHFDASVNVATGLEALSGAVQGVNAYPNPATDHINIAVQADEVGSQIQLFDIQGREVYNATIDQAAYAIDTKALQAGTYSIRVNSIDRLTTYNGRISITH